MLPQTPIFLVGNMASKLAVRVDCGFRSQGPAEDCQPHVPPLPISRVLRDILWGFMRGGPVRQVAATRAAEAELARRKVSLRSSIRKSKMLQEAQRGSTVPGASVPPGPTRLQLQCAKALRDVPKAYKFLDFCSNYRRRECSIVAASTIKSIGSDGQRWIWSRARDS